MYPLYRTPSKEGIFMRYSYEFKRKCVELYRQDVGLQYICLIYLPHSLVICLILLLSATFHAKMWQITER